MATRPEPPDVERFNHTLLYQRHLFDALPAGASSAVDVGCGEGIASRELAARGLRVVGIDADRASIERAKAQGGGVRYLCGDVMTSRLEPGDVVYAGAVVHHLDLERGLTRLASLVAPGGTLLVVGLAASEWPRDFAREAAATVAQVWLRLTRRYWDHGAPTVWPPAHTYREVASAASRLLPGAVFRRRLMWRYTIVWERP